jgi:hypothetical protein
VKNLWNLKMWQIRYIQALVSSYKIQEILIGCRHMLYAEIRSSVYKGPTICFNHTVNFCWVVEFLSYTDLHLYRVYVVTVWIFVMPLTHSMVQDIIWKADCYSAWQKISRFLMEPKGSSLCSQKPAIGPYPEPAESSLPHRSLSP